MKYKKILFLRGSLSTAWVGAVNPPIGIAYLIEALKEHGCECITVDTMLNTGLEDVISEIKKFSPDLIGVSMLTYKYRETYELIKSIKDCFPDLPVIVGGAHVSTLREDVLKECESIDYGFVRDSEESIVEFCKGVELEEIKGLIYRKNGEVVYTGDRNYSKNLDEIKWPKGYGIELNRYLSAEILILSSRGCPYSCIFCPVFLAIGKKLRMRTPIDVVDEIEYWYRQGYKRFAILDDNFTFYKDRTIEICNEIKKRKFDDLILRCGNGIRADRVDKDVLEAMHQAGFTYVSYGVESGSDPVLKTLKKGEKLEEIEKAIKLSTDIGFDVTLFFVVGSPRETVADVEKSIDLSLKYPVLDVRFYNLIPYPGTDLFKWVKEKNYFVRDPAVYLNDSSGLSNDPVFETPELPIAERISLFKKLRKVEKKVRKNAVKRKAHSLGIIGIVGHFLFGGLYANEYFQTLIRQNKILRRLIDFTYSKSVYKQRI